MLSELEPVLDENDEDWLRGGMVGEKVVGEGFGEPLALCWLVLMFPVPSF